MGPVTDLAERCWTGETSHYIGNLSDTLIALEAYSQRVAFQSAFSNVLVVESGDGLVLLDTSSRFHADQVFADVRRWSRSRLHTAVYTHGHVDHVFGTFRFEKEAEANGEPRPRVIGHQNVPARFDRYRLTNGYNGHINMRQFQLPGPVFPTKYRYPDELVGEARTLVVGEVTIELFHDKGETDDHLWAWLPQERALYTGDLFIWASPNCGNPQKVQRYPREWARALRKMAALGPENLFPGHGPPILGAVRAKLALEETAELLETLSEQTLTLMNDGARLDDVLHTVKAPDRLITRPYLRPVYDEPEFIVRNLWRLYGGWYDGKPARLKPPKDAAVALEIASLVGGAAKLVDRALALSATGDHRLACHLAELAGQAAPEDRAVHDARARVYEARAEVEDSLMSKGVFRSAAKASRERSGG